MLQGTTTLLITKFDVRKIFLLLTRVKQCTFQISNMHINFISPKAEAYRVWSTTSVWYYFTGRLEHSFQVNKYYNKYNKKQVVWWQFFNKYASYCYNTSRSFCWRARKCYKFSYFFQFLLTFEMLASISAMVWDLAPLMYYFKYFLS